MTKKPTFSWTFILQFIILTFNVTFIVHMIYHKGELPTDIISMDFFKQYWELFFITILSIAATIRKVGDLHIRKEKDEELGISKSKLTNIVMMALVASIVADLHYIPAIVAAIVSINTDIIILALILVSIVILGAGISLALVITHQDDRKIWKRAISEHFGYWVIFGIAIFVMVVISCWITLHAEPTESKDIIIAMAVGALIANTFGTILVIWENKLEGEKKEKPFKPIYMYCLDLNQRVRLGDIENSHKDDDNKGCKGRADFLNKKLRIKWIKRVEIKDQGKHKQIIAKDKYQIKSLKIEFQETKEKEVIVKFNEGEIYRYQNDKKDKLYIKKKFKDTEIKAEVDKNGDFYSPESISSPDDLKIMRNIGILSDITAIVKMKVVDEDRGGINNAEIKIPELNWTIKTDKRGECKIPLPPRNNMKIKISSEELGSESENYINIYPNARQYMKFYLTGKKEEKKETSVKDNQKK